MLRVSLSGVLACSVVAACADLGGDSRSSGDPAPASGVPSQTGCVPPTREGRVTLTPVFGDATLYGAVDLLHLPGAPDHVAVVEGWGGLRLVAPSQRLLVDLSDRMSPFVGEMGLWDVAYHPRYPDVPSAFAFYTGTGGSTGFRSVLARFHVDPKTHALDPRTEEILIAIERTPNSLHQGGRLSFGPDGYLYVSTGDGGVYGDPDGNAQAPSSLLGKVLRIDVDVDRGYGIPPTNPFATGGGAPEVFALGFRNPWRWSFDRDTGDLWLGDVGHEAEEEIDVVVGGGNYGWNVREGSRCFARDPCDGPELVDPVYHYSHDEGSSVTGGYVYRGSALPDLWGRYVFADYVSERIYALREDGGVDVLVDGVAVSAFAERPDGELYAISFDPARIALLTPASGESADRPRTLLETGCFDAPDAITYDVKVPFWSAGATKERAIVVPPGERISLWKGGLGIPARTTLVKTFSIAGRRVETRLLVKERSGLLTGWSYAWRDDQSDADLVDESRVVDVGGSPWWFPSSGDCRRCHNDTAGGLLGFTPTQLSRDDQQRLLVKYGIIFIPGAYPALAPLGDESASLTTRVRSYLDVNCSMCHRPGGPTPAALDLRITTPLADTGLCDAPTSGAVGIDEEPRIVAFGHPERSVLLRRLSSIDSERMPPLGAPVLDEAAIRLLTTWIETHPSCADEE